MQVDATVPLLVNGRWRIRALPHRAKLKLWQDGWEAERVESMWQNLRPGMKIWDIGAEEGDFAALWSSWGLDVAMVEPSPRVWANIKHTWYANNTKDPLFCYRGFASKVDYMPEGQQETNELWPDSADGPLITDHGFCFANERPDIRSAKIDTLCKRYGPPDAITMDVEGSELWALYGAEQTLIEYKPMVWVSIHVEPMERAYESTPQTLMRFLKDHAGYAQRLLWFDHELHLFAWHPDKTEPVLP